ncbi:hypothetical protein G7046_g4428 [Stylonectria norvegica]|nr:hypothetical protein G7046_g4428 [Stylonectria norvegica]
MPGPEKKWDIVAERDLCVAIILGNQDGDRARHNWPNVHNVMDKLGYHFTKDAISQHYTKVIMKDFKGRHGGDIVKGSRAGTPVETPTGTPRKATATPRKRTPAKRSKIVDQLESEDEDEEPDAKRIKAETSDLLSVKTEQEAPRHRERSATVLDDDVAFDKWVKDSSPK